MNSLSSWLRAILTSAICILLAAIVDMAGSSSAQAAFPERTVRIITGYAPGGTGDFLARLIAGKLAEKWGQPVVVENRDGASATIAAGVVAQAAPDGYTLLLNSSAQALAPAILNLRYDPIKGFVPLYGIGVLPNVLAVNPKHLKVRTMKELIDYARANPGKLNFGSSGVGDATFLSTALMMKAAKIDMVNVNYKGAADITRALLRGDIQVAFPSVSNAAPLAKAGDLVALAVAATQRSALLADVPTVAEAGFPYEDSGAWWGMFATGGTPKAVTDKIGADVAEIIDQPAILQQLQGRGFNMMKMPGDQFKVFVEKDMARDVELMQSLGVKKQ